MNLKDYVRDVKDFPKPGVVFRDITPLLKDSKAFHESIEKMYQHYKDSGVDLIVGPESRGFIFGAALALRMGIGFVPIRKSKLPWKKITQEYDLEYGKDSIEIHQDSIKPSQKVLVVDDLLATGGTSQAIASLIKKLDGDIVSFCFLIELEYLNGRDKIDYDIFSLLKYSS